VLTCALRSFVFVRRAEEGEESSAPNGRERGRSVPTKAASQRAPSPRRVPHHSHNNRYFSLSLSVCVCVSVRAHRCACGDRQQDEEEDEDGKISQPVTDPLGLLGTLSLPPALDKCTRPPPKPPPPNRIPLSTRHGVLTWLLLFRSSSFFFSPSFPPMTVHGGTSFPRGSVA
jgi:hypothetical protein